MAVDSVVVGAGKIVTHGFAKVIADTATADSDSAEKSIWVGAEVVQDSVGFTGVGLGLTEASISWDLPDAQVSEPNDSKYEYAVIAGVDDDPGSQCFIQIDAAAKGKAYAIYGTCDWFSREKSKGQGYLDIDYANWSMGAPVLINP